MRPDNISAHITWKEATHSPTAIRWNIHNVPSVVEVDAMKTLAIRVFEPARAAMGCPIRINSFYRSPELNRVLKGSRTSQHMKGQAMDLDMDGIPCENDNADLFNFIRLKLDFDQLIWEYGTPMKPDWVHVSYVNRIANRGEVLRAMRGGKYIPWK